MTFHFETDCFISILYSSADGHSFWYAWSSDWIDIYFLTPYRLKAVFLSYFYSWKYQIKFHWGQNENSRTLFTVYIFAKSCYVPVYFVTYTSGTTSSTNYQYLRSLPNSWKSTLDQLHLMSSTRQLHYRAILSIISASTFLITFISTAKYFINW